MSSTEREKYQAALTDLVGGRPVAYWPALAKRVGGVKAAVMLSQLLYWNGNAEVQGRDGWFYKSIEDMERETGLTKLEQQTARAVLEKRGIIQARLRGVPRVWHYRVDMVALGDILRLEGGER